MTSTKPNSTPDPTAGASVYSIPLLRYLYDFFVTYISSTYIWRCPTISTQLPFFQSHVSANHLDIGVGSGYYLAKAQLPKDSTITLCDLNSNSLATARKRIPRVKTVCMQHDVFGPLPTREKFGSISLMYLIHCLPGPPERKAAIFGHLKGNLREDGVLFGTTVLGKGVEHNWAGRTLLGLYNRRGIFGNMDDSADVFLRELKIHFEDVDARVEGRVLLFEARGPR